jgi:hypothetical protein
MAEMAEMVLPRAVGSPDSDRRLNNITASLQSHCDEGVTGAHSGDMHVRRKRRMLPSPT